MRQKLNCILLVDDNDADNFIHEMVIKQLDCAEKIVTAENGEEALTFLTTALTSGKYPKPDLIFLDINMPKMNGWEFLEEYEKLHIDQKAKIVLVMLTTSLNPDDKMLAAQKPLILNYIDKPLTQESLTEILEKNFSEYV